MSTGNRDRNASVLTPDDAFSVLGNETRMQILQTLGDANEPLSFTELRDRVGIRQGSQFNYHLDKVVGHFVNKSESGYELRKPGKRVIQAVLSGAVTHDPVLEPREVDQHCYHCGAPVMVDFRNESAGIFCTGCSGNFGFVDEHAPERFDSSELAPELGVIGANRLPPAGVRGRSPIEILRAATAWTHLETFAESADLCPRCSASLEISVDICETHESSGEPCEACGNRQAIHKITECTNCVYSGRALFSLHLFGTPTFLDFMTDHGLNPIAPTAPISFWEHFTPYEEDVISVEPFKARFTFAIDGDTISFTVDDDLAVIDVER